ncbi:AraC family transcriptional regulator [Sphingomonadaceae bacterium jetA1]|jgi:AraC family transcriptional regulator|uniref:AraC family transcriptional regulator n=1 Tax=Facivitalis istanbulensis TaxID=3075838 RepID=UPI00346BA9C0
MTVTGSPYRDRMRRVLDHIEGHADGDCSVETLAGIAAFSPFHFHRQFGATTGLPVARYVHLVRMKRAAYRLAYRTDRITEIAFDAGYDAPDAFARAFRRCLGRSPSAFRKAPDREPWHAAFAPLDQARNQSMPPPFTVHDVTIQDRPAIPVAIMTHRGDLTTLPATIQRFIAWRKARGLKPKDHATFTIFHTDPRTTPPAEHRLDLCVATDRRIEPDDEGVVAGLIPGGRCAVLRVIGQSDDLEPAALFLYRDWLPDSGEELRDFPLHAQRVTFFPDVAEKDAVTDLFLPLR